MPGLPGDKKIYGFNSKRIAEKLVEIADTSASRPLGRFGLVLPPHKVRGARCYVCEATETIPGAARQIGDDLLFPKIPGSGTAKILNRSYTDGNHPLVDWGFADTTSEVIVNNLLSRPYVSGSVFLTVEDMDGDIWIVGSDSNRRKGVVTESGGIDTTTNHGEVTLYIAGAVTSPAVTVDAYINWMNRNSSSVRQPVGEGAECVVEYWPDEDKWFVQQADCL